MPLEYQTYDQLVDIANASLNNEIPSLDPTISNSWASAFVNSLAALAQSNNLQIRDLELQLFPQTATDEFLDRWLEYEGLSRTAATSGRGNATITGIAGSIVPVLTSFTGTNGLIYQNQISATISDITLSVVSITRSGSTATATFIESHGLASGNSVTISGADQSEYNGTFDIIVISETQLNYTVSDSPTTPATGTIFLDSTYASVAFECTTTGNETNIGAGSPITIDIEIAGVDDIASVGSGGFTGGEATEGDESARSRLFISRSSINGVFTAAQIKIAALGINGNTRIFVIEPENPAVSGGPEPGEVFIYFLRDNDVNPLPSSTIIAETKAAIIEFGAKPAHTADADIFVAAPTPVETDYTFSSINPDTITMRTAVEAQINAFYDDTVSVGEDITESSYLGAIANTFDTVNSEKLESFSLSSPSGDISIAIGEIGFSGTVSFP